MKSTIVKLIAASIAMLLGLLLLETTHHVIPLLTGSVMTITGFSYITYSVVEILHDYKVFEFRHYYAVDDPIKENESIIIKELDYNERTQLKYYNDALFRFESILVDEIEPCPHDIKRITGWVKARNEDEAIRILHHTTNWEDLQ